MLMKNKTSLNLIFSILLLSGLLDIQAQELKKSDFFKNKVESRPLLVPVVAPFNYYRLTSIIIGFLVLLLSYLIIWKRKKRTALVAVKRPLTLRT